MLRFLTAIFVVAAPLAASAQQMGSTGQMPGSMPGQPVPTSNQAGAEIAAQRPYDGRPYCRPGQAEGPCQPAPERASLRFEWGFDMMWGVADAEMDLHPIALAIAMPFDFGITRALGVGFRYAYLTAGDAGVDDPATTEFVDASDTTNLNAHVLTAGLRLRLWTDEVDREAWFLDADGGFVLRHDDLGHGPVLRASLGRQFGFSDIGGWGGNFGVGLTYLQGLAGADDFRALLFEWRIFRVEVGIPLPHNADAPEEPAGFTYNAGLELMWVGGNAGREYRSFSLLGGAGITFGLPLARALEPRIRADMLWLGGSEDQDSVTMFAGLGGLRLRLNGIAPVFVEVLGGYELSYGTTPHPIGDGPVVDVAAGLHVPVSDCAGGGAAIRTRFGVGEMNEDLRAIFFVMHFEYGSRPMAIGNPPQLGGGSCGGGPSDYYAAPPPPPAPVVATAQTEIEVPRVEADLNVQIPEVPRVEVEVEVHPVEVEVVLGYALFGGAVQFNLDVNSLPLQQLRDSGFVEVRLEVPPSARARAEAELRGALSRNGVRLDGFAVVETDATAVKAIFTIWPTGSRPPGR